MPDPHTVVGGDDAEHVADKVALTGVIFDGPNLVKAALVIVVRLALSIAGTGASTRALGELGPRAVLEFGDRWATAS